MNTRFSPNLIFKDIHKRWWLTTILMLIGGLFGLIFSTIKSPLFESKADFVITIDYTRTGFLSDIDQDQAMLGIGSLLNSDDVLRRTVKKANDAGYPLTKESFKQKISIEREGFTWSLRVRDHNAEIAAALVNIWSEEANSVYQTAAEHAVKANAYFTYLDSVVSCFQRAITTYQNDYLCSLNNLEYISEEIEATGEIAYQEKVASQGLMPALTAQLVEKGQIQEKPVLFNRNGLILAGSVVGLVAAFLIHLLDHDRQIFHGKRTQ